MWPLAERHLRRIEDALGVKSVTPPGFPPSWHSFKLSGGVLNVTFTPRHATFRWVSADRTEDLLFPSLEDFLRFHRPAQAEWEYPDEYDIDLSSPLDFERSYQRDSGDLQLRTPLAADVPYLDQDYMATASPRSLLFK